jgi:hypothetical protein
VHHTPHLALALVARVLLGATLIALQLAQRRLHLVGVELRLGSRLCAPHAAALLQVRV